MKSEKAISEKLKWLSLYKIAIQLMTAICVCLGVVAVTIVGLNQVPSASTSADVLKALAIIAMFICALIVVLGAKALRIVEADVRVPLAQRKA